MLLHVAEDGSLSFLCTVMLHEYPQCTYPPAIDGRWVASRAGLWSTEP